eukprot:Gb_10934 [translate_table: standard]
MVNNFVHELSEEFSPLDSRQNDMNINQRFGTPSRDHVKISLSVSPGELISTPGISAKSQASCLNSTVVNGIRDSSAGLESFESPQNEQIITRAIIGTLDRSQIQGLRHSGKPGGRQT